jgi:hypothetical protein
MRKSLLLACPIGGTLAAGASDEFLPCVRHTRANDPGASWERRLSSRRNRNTGRGNCSASQVDGCRTVVVAGAVRHRPSQLTRKNMTSTSVFGCRGKELREPFQGFDKQVGCVSKFEINPGEK